MFALLAIFLGLFSAPHHHNHRINTYTLPGEIVHDPGPYVPR
jgi:hypothetical protein